jgi:hypothetical protein
VQAIRAAKDGVRAMALTEHRGRSGPGKVNSRIGGSTRSYAGERCSLFQFLAEWFPSLSLSLPLLFGQQMSYVVDLDWDVEACELNIAARHLTCGGLAQDELEVRGESRL